MMSLRWRLCFAAIVVCEAEMMNFLNFFLNSGVLL
jgi:hypothetical protein